jgi:transposase
VKAKAAKLVELVIQGTSVREAAEQLQVSRRHAFRLLSAPECRQAIDRAGREMARSATMRLQRGAEAAADALCEMAAGTVKATTPRVAAARAVIELVMRATDLDELQSRLAALEAARPAHWEGPQ